MSESLESIIRRWPPEIDWSLLDSCNDSGVPRRFLKEEVWKLLLGPKASLQETVSGESIIRLPIYIPEKIEDHAVEWLCLMLQADIRRGFYQVEPSFELSSLSIEFDEAKSVEELDLNRREALSKVIRDRQLQLWLRLYIKGLHFASEIGRPAQDRYTFIEEIFFPTDEFKQAREAYLDQYKGPVLITGIPRSGKTYTALRLLYDVLEDVNADIKLINAWSNPMELLDFVSDAENELGSVYAVFDDPFGVDEYRDDGAAMAIDVIRTVIAEHPEVRLLITSREEVYQAAVRHHPDLELVPFAKVGFTPERIKTDAALYPEMLERTAWLHGANWRKQLRQFISSEKKPGEEPPAELTDAWRTVLQESYVPGVLLSAFILYPHIAEIDVQDPSAVRSLALLLDRAVDVAAAFRSELETLLQDAKPEQVLYLLLPSLTLVQDETLQALFTREELSSLQKNLGRYFEPTVGDDFSVYSYRYKLDVFAEVAQQLLQDEGLTLLESSILPEFQKRAYQQTSSRIAEVLADVLSRYFWLGGGIGNQYVVTLMQSLEKQGIDSGRLAIGRERDQIYILGSLFQKRDPKLGYDLLVDKLSTAHPLLVSSVASILDQLLTTQIKERVNRIKRITSVVGQLHDRYFVSNNVEEAALRASLLLHGILSHLENYYTAIDKTGVNKENNEKDFGNLLGRTALLERIKKRKENWVLPTLMWLDAIVMKLGELRLYLMEHEIDHLLKFEAVNDSSTNGSELSLKALPQEVIEQYAACKRLYARLLRELRKVGEAIRSGSSMSREEMATLSGGLFFTLAWHNRWCSANRTDDKDNEVDAWANETGWLDEPSDTDAYWDGVFFNMKYHARYFETKASAWQRESAIYRLHSEKAPRLGADTPHESGLPAERLREDWRLKFDEFYKLCLQHLLPYEPMIDLSSIQTESTSEACFLLGMRAPREPGLREEYVARIHFSLRSDCPWRDQLWRAITRLFAFNLREPMDVVSEAIESARQTSNVQVVSAVLDVVDVVEQEFENGELRYAKKNIEALRQIVGDTRRQG